MFLNKDIHLHTDHVAINEKVEKSMSDVRVTSGTDVGSDHKLLVIKL